MGPMPKRCHNCKSEDHLIEECPTLPDEKKRPQKELNNGNDDASATIENESKSTTKPSKPTKNVTKTSKPKK